MINVSVIGGSLGGLCAGVALRNIGCVVDVFERAADPMVSRGAGIVVRDELLSLLRLCEAPPLPTTECTHRQYLEKGGGSSKMKMRQYFTSWGAIYKTLMAAFPEKHYHLSHELTHFEAVDSGVVTHFSNHHSAQSHLLVCADGIRSPARAQLLPDVGLEYSGYVAWRGTVDETELRTELIDFFQNNFSFNSAVSGGHALCYFIPGEQGETEPGKRRLNWVWYVHSKDNGELEQLLTDKDGKRRDYAIPPGMVDDAVVGKLKKASDQELHSQFAKLVQLTKDPFLQSIVDLAVPRMVFDRVCLLGDAAFVVRPHTAAATAKAASDATSLSEALVDLDGQIDAALKRWETSQLHFGKYLLNYGKNLGANWVNNPSS